MFVGTVLIIVAVAGFATAEVPSYIHVCGAKNPNLDQCVIDSVNALADTLKYGIPELDVPSSEPFEIEKMTLIDMPNFKVVGSNVKIYGLPSYHIKFLHLDLEKQNVVIELLLRKIRLVTDYDFTIRVLVPITGKGPMTLESKDIITKVKISYKTVERGNKQHLYFYSMQTKLDAKDFDIKFESNNFDDSLRDAFAKALGNSHQEIFENTKPYIEKAISEKVLELSNKICKHFTYEELFPDRE